MCRRNIIRKERVRNHWNSLGRRIDLEYRQFVIYPLQFIYDSSKLKIRPNGTSKTR